MKFGVLHSKVYICMHSKFKGHEANQYRDIGVDRETEGWMDEWTMKFQYPHSDFYLQV